jgi:hypothetical protein
MANALIAEREVRMRLIDAEVAKEMLVNHAKEFSDVMNRKEKALLIGGGGSCIDKCPTIEVPRWIPVSERLPKREDADHRGRVFVVEKNGEVSIADWRYVNWYPHKTPYWMPLPDAPKDGDSE